MSNVATENVASDERYARQGGHGPRVQVIIPTYNRARKLQRAIESVQAQTWARLEIIVLDNASTDDTRAMVAAMMTADRRLSYARHAYNLGMFGNFNAIPEFATGDYFSFLADDDIYEPCFVEVAMKAFARYPEIAFVAGNCPTRVNGAVVKSQMDYWREGLCRSGTAVTRCLLGHYPVITNCMFRTGVKHVVHFYPELGNPGDAFIMTSLFARYDGYVSKTITGYWENDGDNASSLSQFDAGRMVDAVLFEYGLHQTLRREKFFSFSQLLLARLRRDLIILVGAQRAGINDLLANTRVRAAVGKWTFAAIWLVDKLSLIGGIMLLLRVIRGFSRWRASRAVQTRTPTRNASR
jgi:glycosyltransferase involved in cell wall biosynthesis